MTSDRERLIEEAKLAGRAWPMRSKRRGQTWATWRCCGNKWERQIHVRWPERRFFSPLCPTCGASGVSLEEIIVTETGRGHLKP